MENAQLRVLHVTGVYFPATSFGGPIFTTMGLNDSLQRLEKISLRILTTDSAGPRRKDRIEFHNFPQRFPAGYDVYYCRRSFGVSFSLEMLKHLWGMVAWSDVVHLTGVYTAQTIPTLLCCRLLDKPIVWSPRGSLQRWQKSRRSLLKDVWNALCNALLLKERTVLHVTSQMESASAAHIPRAKVVLVPNGVDAPSGVATRSWLPAGSLRLLYIGRLDPKKGIENLLEALARAHSQSITLAVYGTGAPEYMATLKEQALRLGLNEYVTFKGHVTGIAKEAAFREADVCVLPSHTENFGMVVVEALAHGVPVVVGKGAPWAEVEPRQCGLWVENSPEALADAFKRIRAMNLPEMGERGRQWMMNEFSWPSIAQSMYTLYQSLRTGQLPATTEP